MTTNKRTQSSDLGKTETRKQVRGIDVQSKETSTHYRSLSGVKNLSQTFEDYSLYYVFGDSNNFCRFLDSSHGLSLEIV